MDPVMLIMLVLLVVMIFFMFRNNKKRQEQQQKMRDNLQPGVEVMLGSGIYGRIISVDEESQRAEIASGDAALEVHMGAIAQIVPQPEPEESAPVAADDDPAFAETVDTAADNAEAAAQENAELNIEKPEEGR